MARTTRCDLDDMPAASEAAGYECDPRDVDDMLTELKDMPTTEVRERLLVLEDHPVDDLASSEEEDEIDTLRVVLALRERWGEE